MLLAVDIGNTNIVIGVMEGMEQITSFRMTTCTPRTSDEYGVTIANMIKQGGTNLEDIEDVVISSVVPDIMYSFNNGIRKYLHLEPLVVNSSIKTGLKVVLDNPQLVGADRIVNCVAAREIYGGACIAIDFGTSTTYDIVNQEGEFIGGLITPGIRISADVMTQRAVQLPPIEIKRPDSILDCRNTVSAMQAGLVYGYIGQVEYIVNKIKEELYSPEIKVVATGGLARVIKDGTDVIDYFDSQLTLKGLVILYNMNK